MDFNSLKDQVSNLTLYDLKAGVRKVQNGKLYAQEDISATFELHEQLTVHLTAVMNYTEMEAKVVMHCVLSLYSDGRDLIKGLDRSEKLRTTNRGGHLRR